MATVPNKDGQGIIANGAYGAVDPSYAIPTTWAAGVPTTNAAFTNEVRADTATGIRYIGYAVGTNKWLEMP